jgi:hypothetical protein
MADDFHAIVAAAVSRARTESRLLWADEVADRIVRATPLDARRDDIARRLTVEAIRQNVPVALPSLGK